MEIKEMLLSFDIVGWGYVAETSDVTQPVFNAGVEINVKELSEQDLIRFTNVLKNDIDVKNHFIDLILCTYNRDVVRSIAKKQKKKLKDMKEQLIQSVVDYIENVDFIYWVRADEKGENINWVIGSEKEPPQYITK